jgi:hypothetical protein
LNDVFDGEHFDPTPGFSYALHQNGGDFRVETI